jgi:hypothetical protein
MPGGFSFDYAVASSLSSVPGPTKIFGWAIYAAGFAIWLFGYLSAGHAPLFDWNAAMPWWISSFVPNIEAEIGLALMFASMIPTLPWARLFPFMLFLVLAAATFAWWGFLAWLIWHWGQSRGRDGGVREELAAGVASEAEC